MLFSLLDAHPIVSPAMSFCYVVSCADFHSMMFIFKANVESYTKLIGTKPVGATYKKNDVPTFTIIGAELTLYVVSLVFKAL